jgi:hypothetical protein
MGRNRFARCLPKILRAHYNSLFVIVIWKLIKTDQHRASEFAILKWNTREMKTMSNQITTPNPVDSNSSKIPEKIQKQVDQKDLDRVADGAAEQAGKTEQRYDQGHDIFTK